MKGDAFRKGDAGADMHGPEDPILVGDKTLELLSLRLMLAQLTRVPGAVHEVLDLVPNVGAACGVAMLLAFRVANECASKYDGDQVLTRQDILKRRLPSAVEDAEESLIALGISAAPPQVQFMADLQIYAWRLVAAVLDDRSEASAHTVFDEIERAHVLTHVISTLNGMAAAILVYQLGGRGAAIRETRQQIVTASRND